MDDQPIVNHQQANTSPGQSVNKIFIILMLDGQAIFPRTAIDQIIQTEQEILVLIVMYRCVHSLALSK